MDPAAAFESLWAALEADRRRTLAGFRRPAGAYRQLELEEIHASTGLAGSPLAFDEVATLVEQGIVPGGRRLAECILVADYAEAAALARVASAAPRRQAFVRREEIVALHAHALRRTPNARPGVWRTTTLPAFPSGMVPPPAWLIARDVTALCDRLAAGPADANPLLWVANAHARFTRIQPFTAGNGRTARLLANLLLARLGFPPLVIAARDRERYARARVPFAGRGVPPLAVLFAHALLGSTSTLVAAVRADAALQPVATFASGAERAALYKAAQRRRLRTVRRGSALLTTPAWIEDYRRSRPHG